MPIAIQRRPQHDLLSQEFQRIPSSSEILTSDPVKVPQDELVSAPRRAVHFGGAVEVRPCIHIDDYTDEEYEATWFSPQEIRQIKREMSTTLRIVNRGLLLPAGLTIRGLEYRTKVGNESRKASKNAAWNAVLSEQARQRYMGFTDPVQIANVYLAVSKPCLTSAYTIGEKDAQATHEAKETNKKPEEEEKEGSTIERGETPSSSSSSSRKVKKRFRMFRIRR